MRLRVGGLLSRGRVTYTALLVKGSYFSITTDKRKEGKVHARVARHLNLEGATRLNGSSVKTLEHYKRPKAWGYNQVLAERRVWTYLVV